jgi:hypothetical protein
MQLHSCVPGPVLEHVAEVSSHVFNVFPSSVAIAALQLSISAQLVFPEIPEGMSL